MASLELLFLGPAEAKKSALKKSTPTTKSSNKPKPKKTVTFAAHDTLITIPQEGSGLIWINSGRTLVPIKNKPENQTEQVELARARTKFIKTHRHIWECFEKWRWAGMPRDESERYMVSCIASLHANDEQWSILPHSSRVVWSCIESDYNHRQYLLEKSKLQMEHKVRRRSIAQESGKVHVDHELSATPEDLSQEDHEQGMAATTDSEDAPKDSVPSPPTPGNDQNPIAGSSIPDEEDSQKRKHFRKTFNMSKAMLLINRSSLVCISAVVLVLCVLFHQFEAQARQ